MRQLARNLPSQDGSKRKSRVKEKMMSESGAAKSPSRLKPAARAYKPDRM